MIFMDVSGYCVNQTLYCEKGLEFSLILLFMFTFFAFFFFFSDKGPHVFNVIQKKKNLILFHILCTIHVLTMIRYIYVNIVLKMTILYRSRQKKIVFNVLRCT